MTTIALRERTHALLTADEQIYAARQTGLYLVDREGEDSNLYRSGLPEQDIPTLALALDANSGVMLAGIQGGVARSADGGANWKARQFRVPPPLTTCLLLSSEFGRDSWALAGTYEDGCFRSSDGGRTWLACNHGLFDHSIFCLAAEPMFSAAGIVYAGTGSGLYRSENGGRLWQDIVMPAGDETVLSLAQGEDGRLYAGCESQGLLRSGDGGESWEAILEAGGAINSVALAARGAIITQVDDSVLQSRDAGATWSEIVAADVDCFALAKDGRSLLLALAEGSLQRVDL